MHSKNVFNLVLYSNSHKKQLFIYIKDDVFIKSLNISTDNETSKMDLKSMNLKAILTGLVL